MTESFVIRQTRDNNDINHLIVLHDLGLEKVTVTYDSLAIAVLEEYGSPQELTRALSILNRFCPEMKKKHTETPEQLGNC